MRRRTTSLLALLAMLAAMTLLGASPAGAQHGPEDGHIYADPALDTDGDGDWGKIEFISQVTVHDAEPDQGDDVPSDNLRDAFQRYRSLFDRLLAT